MNNVVRERLREIIATHGRSVCDDQLRCRGLLTDLCGQHRREISVVLCALEEGVATELLNAKNGVPHELLLARLTKRLHDDRALAEDACRWAVESWGLALGVVPEKRSVCPNKDAGTTFDRVINLVRHPVQTTKTYWPEKWTAVFNRSVRAWVASIWLFLAPGRHALWSCLKACRGRIASGCLRSYWHVFCSSFQTWRRCVVTGVVFLGLTVFLAAWFSTLPVQRDRTFDSGLMYPDARGVPTDDLQAVAWYRKAADQGDSRAQNNLGWMYDYGQGVPQDNAQAVFWYRKAADQGHWAARFNLGCMYDCGRGVARDDGQAVAWYRKAADQGHQGAREALYILDRIPQPHRAVIRFYYSVFGLPPLMLWNSLKWLVVTIWNHNVTAYRNCNAVLAVGLYVILVVLIVGVARKVVIAADSWQWQYRQDILYVLRITLLVVALPLLLSLVWLVGGLLFSLLRVVAAWLFAV
jgi:hypothetical protein